MNYGGYPAVVLEDNIESKIDKVKSTIGNVINIIKHETLGIIYLVKVNSWSLPYEEQVIVNDIKCNFGIIPARERFISPNISHIGNNPFKKQP